MNILSDYDAAVLNAARRVLEDLKDAALAQGREETGVFDHLDAGRLAGVADLVSDSVFDVLNTASSFCSDPVAKAALKPAGTPSLREARGELIRALYASTPAAMRILAPLEPLEAVQEPALYDVELRQGRHTRFERVQAANPAEARELARSGDDEPAWAVVSVEKVTPPVAS